MRRYAPFLLWAAVSLSLAQTAVEVREPADTIELWARPVQTIDSSQAKSGEVVTLELWQDVRDQHGGVFLPKGARLFGLLTLVEPHRGDGEARLAIYIMRAEWKGGSAVLNAFLSGPVLRPGKKPEASLLALDRTRVRFVREYSAGPSPQHAHIRVEGDATCGVVFASSEKDIRLSNDVVLPLRHIPVSVLQQSARR